MKNLTAITAAIIATVALTGCDASDTATTQTEVPAETSSSTSQEPTGSDASASQDSSTTTDAASQPATPADTLSATDATETSVPNGDAMAVLDTLAVKGRAPKTGYDRELFSHWTDPDGDGCDGRNQTLRSQLNATDITSGCKVQRGILEVGPYTAKRIVWQRGGGPGIDIDHVVALSDAWQKGAGSWGAAKREQFANDPLNLLAVDASANRQKSDSDAASWLPGNKSYRCEYVARQIAVKGKYDLWVTKSEKDAMSRVLNSCPGQQLPSGGLDPVTSPVEGQPAAEPEVRDEPVVAEPKAESAPDAKEDPSTMTCKELKAAGFGNKFKSGSPHYTKNRDRDGDGVACES